MDTKKYNLFEPEDNPAGINPGREQEIFRDIIRTPELLIEKIVSSGQVTPAGEWYDQEKDEWVILLRGNATLLFENQEPTELWPGDFVFIPAHCRHRVEKTSAQPECIWLAVHGKLSCSRNGAETGQF